MGCTPSKGEVVDNDILLQEIENLRSNQAQQSDEIAKLQVENDRLKQERTNHGFQGDSVQNTGNGVLVKEIEELKTAQVKLEKENERIKKKLQVTSGFQGSPTKPVQQDQSHKKPKVGDPVLAMWSQTMWQYFTATIVSFDVRELKYTITWDDQDPSGRIVDYYNLALDRVPDDDEIANGSVVLFPQGKYRGQEGIRLGGMRYHEGRITKVYKGRDGQKLFDGEHTKGSDDGKWVTYSGYNQHFTGLQRRQLRLSPNVLDILSAETVDSTDGEPTEEDGCDVYISYARTNSPSAIKNKELLPSDLPPSYDEAVMSSICDPRDIRLHLSNSGVQVNSELNGSDVDLMSTVTMINKAKVFVACLSDEYAKNEICRQEFQYAKKTAKKPVIPLVVGSGSFDWQMTVVGLLIAGELYIHFKNKDVQEAKMSELMSAVRRTIPDVVDPEDNGPNLTSNPDTSVSASPQKSGPVDVFISYCWRNSYRAQQAKQINSCIGSEYADARRVQEAIADKGLSVWLDINQLHTSGQGGDSMSLFEQIAEGLGKTKVVVVFVSEEYASSDQCRMEFQFALKSLKKPILPVIVGTGTGWESSVVGLLVAQLNDRVDLSNVDSQVEYSKKVSVIQSTVLGMMGRKEEKGSYKAPVPGDHVVCLHQRWAYFFATIASFNRETMKYTVDWDDGDPTGKVQCYKDLALDAVPSTDQVGVDSLVFFPQGSYHGTDGNNAGGMRWHEGVVTRVYKDSDGVARYDGHHTKSDEDGKWISWKGHDHNFAGLSLEQLRMAPNAMDALMACREAFNLNTASQASVR